MTEPATPLPCPEPGIYIASKTTHAERWKDLRAAGHQIISTWIDEAGAGATSDWSDLWDRCVNEASRAAATIVYVEPGEALKGAYVEMGAALSNGRPVYVVGEMPASVRQHRLVTVCADLGEALVRANDDCRTARRASRVPPPGQAALVEALRAGEEAVRAYDTRVRVPYAISDLDNACRAARAALSAVADGADAAGVGS